MATTTGTDDALMIELLEFAQRDRNDLAIRLLELNARRAEGEITEDEFLDAKAELR